MAGSTPIYGFPYPQSTDLVADYPALGQELATDVETVISGLGSGLNLVTPTSIANTGGSATATGGSISFSGVSSISVNGVFTSTYQNYRVLITTDDASSAALTIRLRAAGSDNSTSNYYNMSDGLNALGVPEMKGTGSSFSIGYSGGTSGYSGDFTYSRPQQTARTYAHGTAVSNNSVFNSITGWRIGSWFDGTTSFDGFTLISSAALTGTIRVFGYKNS
jgi:hypothetical protein